MTVIHDHPILADRIGRLREADLGSPDFRRTMRACGQLLAVLAGTGLSADEVPIGTPLEACTARRLSRPLVLVPVLRAGLGLADGVLDVLDEAVVSHLGLERDEATLKPRTYYHRVAPTLDEAEVWVVDPMLATGGSAVSALTRLREDGAKRLSLLSLVGAPEGVRAVENAHPEVTIHLGALDRELDERGYILPGLGDAGDRCFGTT